MDLLFKNKNAFVMSSSKGIGFGAAKSLAEEGANVIISSSNEDNCLKAIRELEKVGSGKFDYFVCDISDTENYMNKLETILEKWGTLDFLITNAPGPKPIGISDLTREKIEHSFTINVFNIMLATQKCINVMKKTANGGRILHLSGTVSKEPEAGMVLSGTTRAAICNFSKTIASEYGSQRITSNTILTGGVWTERALDLAQLDADKEGVTIDEVLERSNTLFPTGYFPKTDEFGKILTLLLSERCRFLNGVSIPVDGSFMRSF